MRWRSVDGLEIQGSLYRAQGKPYGLIVQGANDPNVTPENLRVVEAALKRAQVPYETLVFADEGHGVRKPENLRVLYQRLIEFFGSAFAD